MALPDTECVILTLGNDMWLHLKCDKDDNFINDVNMIDQIHFSLADDFTKHNSMFSAEGNHRKL